MDAQTQFIILQSHLNGLIQYTLRDISMDCFCNKSLNCFSEKKLVYTYHFLIILKRWKKKIIKNKKETILHLFEYVREVCPWHRKRNNQSIFQTINHRFFFFSFSFNYNSKSCHHFLFFEIEKLLT